MTTLKVYAFFATCAIKALVITVFEKINPVDNQAVRK